MTRAADLWVCVPASRWSLDDLRTTSRGPPDDLCACVLQKKLERKRETLMMRDDTRRIDFVLVYRQSTDKTRTRSRKYFERNLIDEGLELERDDRKVSRPAAILSAPGRNTPASLRLSINIAIKSRLIIPHTVGQD